MPRTWQRALADGALDDKPLLVGTTRDESTAFFAFDPRIRNLTATAALDLLTAQIGRQAALGVYQQYAARLPQATPAQIFTAVQTDVVFRDGSLEVADHHAAGGNTTYVYQFDCAPAEDLHALGATHCAELSFLFNSFDAFSGSPVLAGAGDAQRALGREFATAVAECVAAGTTSDWPPYAPATAAGIRHFG
ncbi:carboxylesterase family protein [Streptomyces sp. MC1]|uniref:carboxylesterase family protein n=1 Tax=Streptomyces sp. MC1 TaxID=295105 RepID=UPI001E35197D|nr:carboxylesterase family protein [Streptomyces sp. MC1]